jgi:hypothetical protein
MRSPSERPGATPEAGWSRGACRCAILCGRPTTERIAGQIRMAAGRMLWLASMMTSTGEQEYGQSTLEAQRVLFSPRPTAP